MEEKVTELNKKTTALAVVYFTSQRENFTSQMVDQSSIPKSHVTGTPSTFEYISNS